MKKILSLLFLLGACYSFNIAAQNLIKGGDMESASKAYWSQYGAASFSGDANTQLVWGDVPGSARSQGYVPAGFGTGNVLTVCEGWGNLQYFIAQPVTLTKNTNYSASFDYDIGAYNQAWFQVYVGTTDPSTVADYTDGQIGNLIPWSSDNSSPNKGSGHFNVSFNSSASGTYYFVIKYGCNGPGYINTSIDNVSLVANGTVGTGSITEVLTGSSLALTQRTWIPERIINSVIVWDNYANCFAQINGGSGAWWAFGTQEIAQGTGREGYFDDQYTFNQAGDFIYSDANTVYLDAAGSVWTKALPSPWNSYLGTYATMRDSTITFSQVIAATNTPTPVTTALYTVVPALQPWSSGKFSYTIALAPAGAYKLGTITVNGLGAHIGLADKNNAGDDVIPKATSITYDVLRITTGLKDATTGATYDEIILGVQEPGLVWTYMFRSDNKSGQGISIVNVNNAIVVGGKSFISAKFNGTENVSVYSIQGQILEKVTAQNTFQSGNLPAGIYIVKIGNKTYKVIVQ